MATRCETGQTLLRQVQNCVKCGLLDTLALHRCLILVYKSEKIRSKLLQCVILNGVIFLGSIFIFSYLISPILVWVLSRTLSSSSGGTSVVDVVAAWIGWVYYSLWIIPVYLLSFILNTLWYQDIATESMRIYPVPVAPHPGPSIQSVTDHIAEAIYRSIFNLVFLLGLTALVNHRWIYLVYLAFFISFNSFEFRYKSVPLQSKIVFFESNWIYFLSFGLPLSVIVVQFPTLIENGLVSLVFPFLLMTASTGSRPAGVTISAHEFNRVTRFGLSWLGRLRVFFLLEFVTNFVVWLIDKFSLK